MIRRSLLASSGVIVIALLAYALGPDVLDLFSNRERLITLLQSLGILAPLGVIVLSAVQIVLAPVPGYLVQALGGYILGVWAGGIAGTLGMLLGASIAFTLSRHLGHPLLRHLLPADQQEKWNRLSAVHSFWTWVIIFLLPVGDFCYFLAGLTRLSLWQMLLAALITRGPSVFVAAYIGARAGEIPRSWFWVVMTAVLGASFIIFLLRDRVEGMVYDHLLEPILHRQPPEEGTRHG